jgi:hypothetical protein
MMILPKSSIKKMISIKLVRCPNKQRVSSKSEQDLVYNLPQAMSSGVTLDV